jgi:hypothetical protein
MKTKGDIDTLFEEEIKRAHALRCKAEADNCHVGDEEEMIPSCAQYVAYTTPASVEEWHIAAPADAWRSFTSSPAAAEVLRTLQKGRKISWCHALPGLLPAPPAGLSQCTLSADYS